MTARTTTIHINDALFIDPGEIAFAFARSAGPGGQNVNKVATKATLEFDVARSPSLNEKQRVALLAALAGRINKDGVLRISSSRHRTQVANRREALRRFIELLAEALRPRTPRRPTKPTRTSVERRLTAKTRRGRLKLERRRPFDREEHPQ